MTDTQKQAWKEGVSGLDIALVDSPAFVKWWPWVWKIALVIAVGAFGRFASQANDAHKAKLKAIETALVVLPELVTLKPVKVKTAKSATVKIAPKAINTPATPEAGITVSVPVQVPAPVPETQFDRDLINFESKL
jgi:hypothetical protein